MMSKKHKILLWGMMLTLIISSMGVFTEGNASALTYSSDTDIEFTFNSVISINLSSPNLVISDLAPGEYSDSNIITVGATTNGSTGFQLSATVGQKNGTDALVNTVSSSNTFANLTSTQATLAGFSDNTWGYSYCADSSTNCGNGGSATWVSGSKGSTTAGYAGLPLDNNDNVADRGNGGVLLLNTSGPEDTIQSVQFKIGAKASSGQASGDYTNTINFYAVANPEPQLGPVSCEAGKICYNVNALTPTEGTMGQQSKDDSNNNITNGSTVTLLASNFSRNGYGFAGWNTAYDYSGTNYGPNETITTPANTSTNGLSLYAIWVKSTGSLQNWSGCSSLPQGSVTALTDQRDGETYAVAKLADGKCWMIENLRLEADDSDDETLAQGFGKSTTYGNFAGLADAESTDFSSSTAANSLYYSGTQSGTASVNIGTSNIPGYRIPRYNNLNTQNRAQNNPNSNTFTENNTTGGMYSYGNYYTWSAAMANTIYYSNPTATDADGKTSETVNTSLCPTGWKLPRGGNKSREATNDFWALIVTGINNGTNPANYDSSTTPYYNGTAEAGPVANALRAYPNNFLYSGRFDMSLPLARGSDGYYWSSTASYVGRSYRLTLGSSYVYPGNDDINKYLGYSIRCTLGS